MKLVFGGGGYWANFVIMWLLSKYLATHTHTHTYRTFVIIIIISRDTESNVSTHPKAHARLLHPELLKASGSLEQYREHWAKSLSE